MNIIKYKIHWFYITVILCMPAMLIFILYSIKKLIALITRNSLWEIDFLLNTFGDVVIKHSSFDFILSIISYIIENLTMYLIKLLS